MNVMMVVVVMMMVVVVVMMITFMQNPDTSDHITGSRSSMASTEQKWCICQQLVLKHKVLPQGHITNHNHRCLIQNILENKHAVF